MTGDADYLAIAICAAVISLTLWVTFAVSRRARSADGFFAAGRSISSWQNGFAIAGEFISAGSFLGTTGLIFYKGVDGAVILCTSVISFLPVLFLLAEKMRNVGKYTLADVLVFRTEARSVRVVVALSTIATGTFVLLAQLVAAGVLLESVSGIPFWLSVIVAGTLMGIYVFVGGMLATTWVQVIKSTILSVLAIVVGLGILAQFGFSFPKVLDTATEHAVAGEAVLSPGLIFGQTSALNLVSYSLAFALGTAGMAHILIRFFTVPEASTARRSLGWTVALCSMFYLIVIVMGFGAAALLGDGGADRVGAGGNLAAPVLVTELGGGVGTIGGSIALAMVAAVAFASIVAVVAGVVISAAGTFARDIWPALTRKPPVDELDVTARTREENAQARVARFGAVAFSAVAIGLTMLIGDDTNITYFMGMAFMVAGSAHLPSLVLSLNWRRFNSTGAVWGILTGLVSTIVSLMLTEALWLGSGPAPLTIQLPVIVTMPLGLAACVVGSLVAEKRRGRSAHEDEKFAEMLVRAETGIGAEVATAH
ncbi:MULTISPECIES: cation acetate symporter [Rhodococcus]|jgi:cation/acetate symporter|uniref:Cation acetate symporter n=1 Tax=Rhodococcus aetherivorans TaxID=191292 RepID=A0A059MJ89_9NOCA|nr:MULTISPECIES: cation acetate symporter [Rhodococcus]ETT23417.1 Na+/solute symporter [Rhodococcus rhodochrous ATCC 21198]AKE91975.1 sodium:solute symporter [Rhodococcus aetherivorans]ANZ27765.1 cation acetate symporter [Rhodococcus sp. WB1]KDE11092.1 sodium:solute symporter [Rhodococcus aetherivorans]MBC2589927.1 cation acetate symporter [Rhodococcus aetherivorans]